MIISYNYDNSQLFLESHSKFHGSSHHQPGDFPATFAYQRVTPLRAPEIVALHRVQSLQSMLQNHIWQFMGGGPKQGQFPNFKNWDLTSEIKILPKKKWDWYQR